MQYPHVYLLSNQSAATYCNIFFAKNMYATGEQILTICPSRQAGLLILQTIHQQLINQANNWESPYFDYSATEVRLIIEQFKNLLSTNIRLQQSVLEPLLASAIYQTWHLLFDPIDFMSGYFDNLDIKNQNYDYLQSQVRFYQHYKTPLNLTLQEFQQSEAEFKTQDWIDSFSNNLKINPESSALIEFSKFMDWPADVVQNLVIISHSNDNKLVNFYQKIHSDNANNQVLNDTDLSTAIENTKPEDKVQIVEIVENPNASSSVFLHQYVKENSSNLHSSLAEKRLDTNAESIHFTIYEKFLYINELFGGDSRSFNQAIQLLESSTDKKQTFQQLIESQSVKNDWASRADFAEPFIAILQKYTNFYN